MYNWNIYFEPQNGFKKNDKLRQYQFFVLVIVWFELQNIIGDVSVIFLLI